MTGKITIRNVPEHVRDALAMQAAEAGKSLQQFLLEELGRLVESPSNAQILEQLKLDKAKATTTLSAAGILEYRDADRR